MTAFIKKNFFKKMAVMPKGKLLKMKGIICNIPVNEVDVNCKSLPRPADSNSLLIVKLKHKLEYKLHVVFESVRLALVIQFLEFLKNHNHLIQINQRYLRYNNKQGIQINPDNISVDLPHSQSGNSEE